MRRKRRNKKLIIMIIVFIISIFSLTVGYSLLQKSLLIQATGNMILDTEEDYTSEHLNLTYKTNSWYSNNEYYYQIDITLENISVYTIENWKIVMEVPDLVKFHAGWNGEFNTSGDKITITPLIYNNNIFSGSNIGIGLQIIVSKDVLDISKIKLYGNPINI